MGIKWLGENEHDRERKEKQTRAWNELRAEGKPTSAAAIEAKIEEWRKQTDAQMPITIAQLYRSQFQRQSSVFNAFSGAGITLSLDPTPALQPELTVVEAITGWRRWSVTMFGRKLLSNNGTEWKPFAELEAECKKPALTVFGEPVGCRGLRCACGIYAYKERSQAASGDNAPTDLLHIWGEVYLWGRVVEHEKGWRGQYAYPKAFVNTGGIARQLAETYGVKLITEVANATIQSKSNRETDGENTDRVN